MEVFCIKYVFFDVDGVLALPKFRGSDGDLKIGGGDDWWLKESIGKQKSYKYCGVPEKIKKYLHYFLNKEKAKIYALSVVASPDEYFSKIDFLPKNRFSSEK